MVFPPVRLGRASAKWCKLIGEGQGCAATLLVAKRGDDMRPTRNTYQNGWIETRASKKDGLVFVYRWRERKPSGGYRKRTELIGPVSVLKTEANAWRAIEQRKLEINSEDSKRETVTMNSVINRYLEEELP